MACGEDSPASNQKAEISKEKPKQVKTKSKLLLKGSKALLKSITSLHTKKIILPYGIRGSKMIEMYSKVDVFNLKTCRKNSFSTVTNNFKDAMYKFSIDQVDTATGVKGIYPSCMIYLKNYDLFAMGSTNYNMENYLIFVRYKFEKHSGIYQVNFIHRIRTVDKLTRIHVNSEEKHMILAFSNEFTCCLKIKKRKGDVVFKEGENLKGSCLWAENRNDLMMSYSIEKQSENIKSKKMEIPVIKFMWELKKGFYYKTVDFVYLNITRLLKNKFWTKKMEKKVLKRLNQKLEEALKKKKEKTGKIYFKFRFFKKRSNCYHGIFILQYLWGKRSETY